METRLLLVLALFLATAGAWMDPAWLYRVPITVNNSGVALADYQLAVDTSSLVYNNAGLVGSWHFSEGAGTKAADSSGLGNDGTLSGASWTTGKAGYAPSFNGINSYVQVPHKASLSPTSQVTLSMWVNPLSYPASGTWATPLTKEWIYYFNLESSGTITGNVKVAQNTGFAIPLNAYTHIALTYDGAVQRLYVNGGLVKENAATGAIVDSWSSPLYIGRRGDGRYFNGTIDEVRIYSRALSVQEVSALYNAKLKPDYGDLRFSQNYTIYETPVSVSGTSASVAGYQVLVNITSPAILSHMRPDGADLRFFSAPSASPYSQASLLYWIASISPTNAAVWVRTDVSTAASTIYMYYGNTTAQAISNPTATFDFYEDFEDGNYNGWTTNYYNQYGSSDSVTMVTGSPSGFWRVRNTHGGFACGYAMLQRTIALPSARYAVRLKTRYDYSGSKCDANDGIGYILGFGGTSRFWYLMPNENNAWSGGNVGTGWSSTAQNTEISGEFRTSDYYSGAITSLDMNIRVQNLATNINLYTDDIIVRKYSSPEPAATVGTESVKSTGEALLNQWQESDNRAWVKVGRIQGGANAIYAYYGNPAANGTGSAYSVLDLLEDFSGTSLNSSLWAQSGYSGTVSVGSGLAELYIYWTGNVWARWAQVDAVPAVTGDFNVQVDINALGLYPGEGNNYYAYVYAVKPDASTTEVFRDQHGSGGGTWSYGSATPLITWLHGVQLPQYYTSGTLGIGRRGSTWTASLAGNTQTWTDTAADVKLRFLVTTAGAADGYMRLDKVTVRRYASPEPSLLLGTEERSGYHLLVRRCGAKQVGANVTAYSANATAGSCASDTNGICTLVISAGTYDLQFLFADNSTAWKNGTVFS